MVSRTLIKAEIRRFKKIPEDERGSLKDHMRVFLEENIPPEERRIERGNETIDAVDHILADL